MKLPIFFRTTALLTAFCAGLNSMAQFVTLEGRQFMLNGQEFYPRVLNYHGQLASDQNGTTDPSHVYCSPLSDYGGAIYSGLECDSWPSCNTQLQQHFAKIDSMGFNTIRLWVAPYMRFDSTGNRLMSVTIRHHGSSIWDWSSFYPMDLDYPNFTGPMAMQYFDILRNVLDQAQSQGLKVILLCCNPNSGLETETSFVQAADWDAVHRFTAYLTRLAAELQGHPALLAYDLFNEPLRKTHSESSEIMNWTKSQVCAITSEWYDAIKSKDTNHLVTLGGQNPFDMDVWDPSTMKLDFYSAHLYLQYGPSQYPGGIDVSAASNRYGNRLYWLGSSCSMPYLVGETGFSAEDDTVNPQGESNLLDAIPAHHKYPYMDGNETEQAAFAQYSMDATRDYLGSGYSWWEFQNIKWYRIPAAGEVVKDYKENFFGPLKYGDSTHPWSDKLVVSTLEDYSLPPYAGTLPNEPVNYHNWYNCNGIELQKWYVKDQYGRFIKDAIVEVRNHYYYSINGQYHDYADQAAFELNNTLITREDGLVSIRAAINSPDFYTSWSEVWVRIPGSKMRYYANHYDTPPSNYFPSWGSTVTNVRDHMDFDGSEDALDVPIGASRDLKAWNSITLDNAYVHGNGSTGGTADLHARQSVHIPSTAEFQLGCEVHIWTDETFADCGNTAYQSMVPANSGSTAATPAPVKQKGNKKVVLHFAKENVGLLAVYPNPCRDEVTVSTDEAGGVCHLQSPDGVLLFSGPMDGNLLQIPMSSYASGTYVVTVQFADHSYTKTITKAQ